VNMESWNFFLLLRLFLVMILQLGMGSAIFRAVIYKQKTDSGLILSTAFYFLLVANIISVNILCYYSEELSQAIFERPDRSFILQLLFITDFFLVLTILPMAKLRIDERSTLFTIIAFGNFTIGVILTILFVVVFNKGVEGIFWAQLINATIFALVYTSVIFREIQFKFSWNELKDMLGFGLPLVPASVAMSILMLSNRYFLSRYGTAEDVGVFSVGYRMAQVLALIVNAFQMAWPTLLFTIIKEEYAERTYSRLLTYFLFGLTGISLGISIFGRELIVVITTPEFIEAQHILPLLLVSNMLWGVFYMTSIGIQVKKKTIYSALVTGLAAVVNLMLNFWLISIPNFRLFGAALASLGGNLVLAILTLLISLHFYYIRYEYGKILKLFLWAVLAYCAGLFVPTHYFLVAIILKVMIFGLFFLAVYWCHFFTEGEIKKAKEVVQMIGCLITRRKNK